MMTLDEFYQKRLKESPRIRQWFKRLKQNRKVLLDVFFHRAHTEVFEKTNCLNCANCCATTSPVFYQSDIERSAKALRLKPGAFIQKYLQMDEEGDFVLTQAPCPFLSADRSCSIYSHRPKACREYPHTNRKHIRQILDITEKNTQVCPAVLEIVQNVQKQLKDGGITI
jgi:Fe-S-cluster containining protein